MALTLLSRKPQSVMERLSRNAIMRAYRSDGCLGMVLPNRIVDDNDFIGMAANRLD